MRSVVIALLAAALVAVLALTNPDKGDFALAYADRLNAELAEGIGLEGPVGEAIGSVTQRALAAAIEEQTIRRDYLVASVFILPAAGEDLRVLGALQRFVRLDGGG